MIALLNDLPDHVVGARLTAPAAGDEFDRIVRPRLADVLSRYRKVNVLIELPDGPEAEAGIKRLLQGGGLGIDDLRQFDRLALVSDLDWLKRKLSLFGLFAPCSVKRFSETDLPAARRWVSHL